MAEINPYEPPASLVADVSTAVAGKDGEPVSVPAGNGWQWITDGFALFKLQPWLWIGMMIAWFVFIYVISRIPYLGSVVLYVVGPVVLGGVMLGCRALESGEPLRFSHLFAGFSRNTGALATVGVLMLLAYVALLVVIAAIFGTGIVMMFLGSPTAATATSFATVGLAYLVLLAFSIPLSMAYWFAPARIVFRDTTAMEAMKTSFSACLKNIVPFLVYGIAAFVLLIGASIPLGLGLFVLLPTLAASIYASYRDIFQG